MTLPRSVRRSTTRLSPSLFNATRSGRFVILLAACASLGWGCGGTEAGDAVGGGDGGGAIPDGSREAGSTDAKAYTGPCTISASSYEQSCTVDTDCTTVTSTDYCSANCLCGGSAINVGALAQFNEDTAKTPLGSGALGGAACPCAPALGPCCRGGTCSATCFSPADTLPACADAGGTCLLGTNSICSKPAPAGACAYSDEVCCVN
jgi:hypothetical protein